MTETTQHKSNTPIEWEQAEGFSKYLISTDGQVYSLKSDRLYRKALPIEDISRLMCAMMRESKST